MDFKALLELKLGLGRGVVFLQCKQEIEGRKYNWEVGPGNLNWKPRRAFITF